MKDKKRLIMLISLAVIVVVVLAISATYAFMKASSNTRAVTTVSVHSCAKIKLVGESSINLTNSYAMSRNVALKETPYTFEIESTCEESGNVLIILATLNTNTLPNSDIHYILTDDSDIVLNEGILSDATTLSLTTEEKRQLDSGLNGTTNYIYQIYTPSVAANTKVKLKLYLYIDAAATLPNTSKTFNAGVAIKRAQISL